jgi:hypothetical protein
MQYVFAKYFYIFLQSIPIDLFHENRDEFVATLADLTLGLVHADLNSEMFKRPAPCLGMQGVTVH